jgi:hypothetical protein
MNSAIIKSLALSAMLSIFTFAHSPALGQLGPPTGPSFGGSVPHSKKVATGIAWHGVLKDGLDEAKKTGKPILFITAAAQCGGVPGMW